MYMQRAAPGAGNMFPTRQSRRAKVMEKDAFVDVRSRQAVNDAKSGMHA